MNGAAVDGCDQVDGVTMGSPGGRSPSALSGSPTG